MVKVEHWNTNADGFLSEDALINKFQCLGYTCMTYTYPPGTCFDNHTHKQDKIDAVLKGHFCIEIENEAVSLKAGDWLHVPRNTVHNARVIGNESVISIDAVRY